MSFFPEGFDPRGDAIGLIDLVELDTPDGVMRFMLGADGRFTDVNGNTWYGSQLLSASGLESAIDGVAPAGTLSAAFIQDPDAPSVVSELRALGPEYLAGRAARFYVQPLARIEEIYAPVHPPQLWLTRTMRTLTLAAQGPVSREVSIGLEAWSEGRRTAARIALNTAGHAALIGEENPSLEWIPTTDFEEEKLWE
ncbi:hypothetical protein [Marinibacterium profundimaris]|uniref:Uncharacterized protein n=1 Tax=Marinibacterium profundimaris TaxID=1679460 RepID=A0A225NW48_9RHOB|nr:hypothetical protein [Marinibacterium profundimaris]OWU77597.1 hypothetical protein ATO3_02610 [Marinibacterium profundimaris]